MISQQDILATFSTLGPRLTRLPRAFVSYPLPHWRNPLLSPIFPVASTATRRGLAALERYFAQNPVKGLSQWNEPYVNWIDGMNFHNEKRLIQVCEDAGWTEVKTKSNLCVLTKPRVVQLPKNYSYEVGEYFAPRFHRGYHEVLGAAFRRLKPHMNQVTRAVRYCAAPTTVLIYNAQGKLAAGGAVFRKGRAAYLFGGGVMPSFRGRGLWYALTAIRMQIAQSYGAKFSVYSSANPRICRKGDYNFGLKAYALRESE